MLVLVCRLTWRTAPLESGNVFITLPIIQELRRADSSTIKTTSPGRKFLFVLDHFCHSWRSGRYSLVHLVQNRSAMYWTCFQRRRAYWSSLVKIPEGMLGCVFSSNKWLGVSASRSLRSSDVLVMGLLLMIASTSHMMVWRPSSSSGWSLSTELRIFLTVRICLSHTPPWWEAAGVLNIHLIPLCIMVLCIFAWFSFSTSSRSSLSRQQN